MKNLEPREIIKNHTEISKMYTSDEIDKMNFPELGELINLYNDLKTK